MSGLSRFCRQLMSQAVCFIIVVAGNAIGQGAPTVPEPGLVQLTNSLGENAVQPDWSPKGDLISFISNRGSGNGRMNDVWAVAPDGSNVHQLTAMPDDGFEQGTRFAVWIGSTGDLVMLDSNIFYEWLRVRLAQNPALPLVRTAFDGPSPGFDELLTIPGGLGGLTFAVSRDGQSAAWTAMVTQPTSCPWFTNAIVAPSNVLNGQATTSLGTVLASASFDCNQIQKSEAIIGLSFSPDNSQVVLARAPDPSIVGYDLEIYSTDGTFIRKLTNNAISQVPVINWNPSWSSDGCIAFASNQSGRFEIYTINPDGSNLKPITTNGGDWPTWSPDSSEIAFQSTRNGNSEIYSIPVSRNGPVIGTIFVSTNNAAATFTITDGLHTFTGSGTAFTQAAPSGIYMITFGPVSGFNTPNPQNQTLTNGRSINFTGNYQMLPSICTSPTFQEIVQNGVALPTVSPGIIETSFQPNCGLTLQQAAALGGYDHFNWAQIITRDDATSNPLFLPYAILGGLTYCLPGYVGVGWFAIGCSYVPSVPYFDPPHGGYAYEEASVLAPVEDNLDWYEDEVFSAGPPFVPADHSRGICTQLENVEGADLHCSTTGSKILEFEDDPKCGIPQIGLNCTISFSTTLVGVRADGTGDVLNLGNTGFDWHVVDSTISIDQQRHGVQSSPGALIFVDGFKQPGIQGFSQPELETLASRGVRVWSDTGIVIPVTIDIKPGEFPNSINSHSKGLITVAIISTASFNAVTQVDQGSLTFGRTGAEKSLDFCHGEDVNGDGLLDLVCHFHTSQTLFQMGDTLGRLAGKNLIGLPIYGEDSVRIVLVN